LVLNTLIDAESTARQIASSSVAGRQCPHREERSDEATGVSLQRGNAGERLVRIPFSPGSSQGFAIPCQELRIVVPDILCVSNGVERARRISGVNTESAI
jgi:hypothetical protein